MEIDQEEKDKEIDEYLDKAHNTVLTIWPINCKGTKQLPCSEFVRNWELSMMPIPNGNGVFDPDEGGIPVEETFLGTLEDLIYDDEKEHITKVLSEDRVTYCGKIFKNGETFFSCRDCSIDYTCVICITCFLKSAHRNHRYRMGISQGGGCCDCGDESSWKHYPHCDNHIKTLSGLTNSRFSLPALFRLRLVIETIFKSTYENLTRQSNTTGAAYTSSPFKCSDNESLADCDVYCIVLYNDEIHCYDQVVEFLSERFGLTTSDAFEVTSYIDKEGRAVLKFANLATCKKIIEEAETYTRNRQLKPFILKIIHWCGIAQHVLDIRLLSWLENFVKYTREFRNVITRVGLNLICPSHSYAVNDQELSLVEAIFIRESEFWKRPRIQWHNIFLSCMLINYENKKSFAKVFLKHYDTITTEFIHEKYDHSLSASSLSVQMFTVTSIAHYLISREDALNKILSTFYSHCMAYCNDDGKLEFNISEARGSFLRLLSVLNDAKYLLSTLPREWSQSLRIKFMNGLGALIEIFITMQYMHPLIRREKTHIEYEPHFTYQIKLQHRLIPVTTQILKWCISDKTVLVECCKMTLTKLHENPAPGSTNRRNYKLMEFAGHQVKSCEYNVSKHPVSFYLPLSRFFTGLYLHFHKTSRDLNSHHFQGIRRPTIEKIIDPVLRLRVMIAQVRAGMWKKNGQSLVSQLNFYQSPGAQMEMHDKDISLLQLGACLIENNEFLIHVLSKFDLLSWLSEDFDFSCIDDDTMKEKSTLVEEFLSLVISIIGERYNSVISKVSDEDCVKYEIMHRLLGEPQTPSTLNEKLPGDLYRDATSIKIISDIADYKRNANGKKGQYIVKEELLKNYNIYFFHYKRTDKSRSEEEVIKRRKALDGTDYCPPPVLPRLKKSFREISSLLLCDVMLQVLRVVLNRGLDPSFSNCSEDQLHGALFLIGIALQEEECSNYKSVELKFTDVAEKWKIKNILEQLAVCDHIDTNKGLVLWTLNKYKSLTESTDSSDLNKVIPSEKEDLQSKALRSSKVAERRAALVAQMALLQQKFLKNNPNIFNEEDEGNNRSIGVGQSSDEIEHGSTDVSKRVLNSGRCILCQEDQIISLDSPKALVLAVFIQKSGVLITASDHLFNILEINNKKSGINSYISTCGHIMHRKCWADYISDTYLAYSRRRYRVKQGFDPKYCEYLCPLCKSISNSIMPLLPDYYSNDFQTTVTNLEKRSLATDDPNNSSVAFEEYLAGLLNMNDTDFKSPVNDKGDSSDSQECEMMDQDEPMMDQDEPMMDQGEPMMDQDEPMNESSIPQTSMSPRSLYARYKVNPGVNFSIEVLEALSRFTENINMQAGTGGISTPAESCLFFWHDFAYTLNSIESYLNLANKPLLNSLSSRDETCLKTLINVSFTLSSLRKSELEKFKIHNTILHRLLNSINYNRNFLDFDCLELFIVLKMTAPLLENKFSHNLFKLVFLLRIAQIIMLTDANDFTVSDEDVSYDDTKCLIKIVQMLKNIEKVNTVKVWEVVKLKSLSFLRCCAIFHYYATGIEPLKEFNEIGGDTFENIMTFFNLPSNCKELIADIPIICDIFSGWVKHPTIQTLNKVTISSDLVIPKKFIDLPHEYCDIISKGASFDCPESGNIKYPALCLLCGELVCINDLCSKSVIGNLPLGPVTYHTLKCGLGVCAFLLVKQCEVSLHTAFPHRSTTIAAPYFDEFGESDQNLSRGNPLYLCKEEYHNLQMMWASHTIQETVSRLIESTIPFSLLWNQLNQ